MPEPSWFSPEDPRWQLSPGYRIDRWEEQDMVREQDVVALWTSEAGLPPAEAERRLSEILLVCTDSRGQLAGLTTTYLQHNAQLRAEMWYFRAFVSAAHRQFNIATSVALAGRDHLVHATSQVRIAAVWGHLRG